MHENTADSQRAQTAQNEARTPEQKKAAADAAQKASDAAAKKNLTKVKATANFTANDGTKVKENDVVALDAAETKFRLDNHQVTKDLS